MITICLLFQLHAHVHCYFHFYHCAFSLCMFLARVCTVTRFLHRHICNFWHFMFYLYHHHLVLHDIHVRMGLLLYNCVAFI